MKNILIVTGAGSGIGKETAIGINSLFDQVILISQNLSKLQNTKQAILEQKKHTDNSVTICSCDLSGQNNITNMIEQLDPLLSKAFSVSLINNAAIYTGAKSFENSKSEDWETYFKTNLLGTINLTRALLPYMKAKTFKEASLTKLGDYHSIINIASTAGTRVVSGLSAYGSLKAALIHWSHTIALELAPKYICVNVVAPGLIDTPIHSFYSKDKSSKEYLQATNAQALKRMGQPKDVVNAIKYLCTSSWVTGSTLIVDGGVSL